ncbi:MAG: DUF2807 domain-containing protein [Amphiplicatus sp.]
MTKTLSGLVAASALLLASGAASAAEKTFDFTDFDSVSVAAGVHAVIAAGADYSVRAESSEEGLEKLEINVGGGKLRIGRKQSVSFFGRQPAITVHVAMPALSALDISSGSTTEASSVAAGSFDLNGSSGAHATIKGECAALDLDISSGAHIDAEDLKCKSARANASSGGSATLFASESLNADASSGGLLTVHGAPTNVTTDKSSGGRVRLVR